MSRFYIKYTPPMRGASNVEYLQDYLHDNISDVTFTPSFNDEFNIFGILDGRGDNLSKVLPIISSRHSAVRLTKNEYIGASLNAFVPYTGPDIPIEGEPGYLPPDRRPDWVIWMAEQGIEVDNDKKLDYYKKYKFNLLKEISKKKFADDNDSIADLSKALMAIVVYYNILTPEQKVIVDEKIEILKKTYSVENAINGLTELTDHLTNSLIGYYKIKKSVNDATTKNQIDNIKFE